MPPNPSTRPASAVREIRSPPQNRPMSIEKRGIVPTKIAAIAVPIRGVANERPSSWPATVVAPTAASGRQLPKARRLRVARAIATRIALAVSARKLTAPTQPNASTTRRTRTNETPQMSAMAR